MTWLAQQLADWNDHKVVDDDARTVCWMLARLAEYDALLADIDNGSVVVAEAQDLKERLDHGPLHDREGYSLNDEKQSCAPFSKWAANTDPV